MRETIRAKRLFHVFAPRRSGHHAIMGWILAQLQPHTKHLNNRRMPVVLRRVNWYDYARRPVLNALMINYEDKDPAIVYDLSYKMWKPVVRGLDAEKTQYLVVLRDPYNNLASKRRANPERGMEAARREARVWKSLAREFLGITNYLPNKTAISYNRWFAERAYRRQLSRRLELDFNDECDEAEEALLAVPGRRRGESQFDGRRYDGTAQQMDVLNRWRLLEDDPVYVEQFRDKELILLADRIFQVEGIESLLARVPASQRQDRG